ncbi:MAG: hypothetical protein C0516_07340 [Gemmatimonas sp.]|nr:hypothetical protein [Gemmatimonas sp.]
MAAGPPGGPPGGPAGWASMALGAKASRPPTRRTEYEERMRGMIRNGGVTGSRRPGHVRNRIRTCTYA